MQSSVETKNIESNLELSSNCNLSWKKIKGRGVTKQERSLTASKEKTLKETRHGQHCPSLSIDQLMLDLALFVLMQDKDS